MIEVLQTRIDALLPKNARCYVQPLMHPVTGDINVHFEFGSQENRPWYTGQGMVPVDATDEHLVTFIESIPMKLVGTQYPANAQMKDLI